MSAKSESFLGMRLVKLKEVTKLRGLSAKSVQLHFSYFRETPAINLLHSYTCGFIVLVNFYMCNKLVSIEHEEQKTANKTGSKGQF